MSLKQQLHDWIKRDGYVPYQDIKQACENGSLGQYYKISNAERRLRQSESPLIESVKEKNYIKGYRLVKLTLF